MKNLSDTIKHDDWKTEKHVPTTEILSQECENNMVSLRVSVGKEVPHPNTNDHHIPWIKLFFLPDDSSFPVEVGSYRFTSPEADSSAVESTPSVSIQLHLPGSGTLMALSYCNLHGLWQSQVRVDLS